MESFLSADGQVAKFIHADGSETAVKAVKSCSSFIDPDTGAARTEWVDRGKYSIFLSSSLGCYMKCPFCHLTIKNSAFAKLTPEQIFQNAVQALSHELERKSELAGRYAKICWMGMGDAANVPEAVRDVSLRLADWIMANNAAKGIDCVDLSTVLPPVRSGWVRIFSELNRALEPYPANPQNLKIEQAALSSKAEYDRRSRFRLFYSLHSALQDTRDKMVPGAMSLEKAREQLLEYRAGGADLLFHQLFVENLNDSHEQAEAILSFLEKGFSDCELRILRYNFCDRSPYKEWSRIDMAIKRIVAAHERVKVQISAGSEVAAACGQFLVAYPAKPKASPLPNPDPDALAG